MTSIRNSETADLAVRALMLASVVGDAIQVVGEIPAGHLYAMLMDRMNIQQFDAIIGVLKRARLVSEAAHMLTWIGPAKAVRA